MTFINELLEFWINTHWLIAFLMSAMTNILVYVIASSFLSLVIGKLVERGQGTHIDQRPLKEEQFRWEIKFGLTTCFIFALGSLASRGLFDGLWPTSISDFAWQWVSFVVFYETYSYFVHRLLHLKPFSRYHYVHHWSVRVTPWSSYSVHPIEAAFIGFSAPIFMTMFSLSLGLALLFHVGGMVFTILLHSNFKIQSNNGLIQWVFKYSQDHSSHHRLGKFNFGFVNSFWDRVLNTRYRKVIE
ncbi:sterol desaturase family protein [Pleionea sp. CnH1-48]|uniref:sterol desaturase family protein n=1 Tax=Pleionea sp. CnH1-48 TaxID=2954494 RepID=UPI0020981EF9|nr:sterol desaturase family protein [Pleionea sp. CnH1-48]MCO7222714.1 sterol desaturase family protein [Pleionea sp. CnH1-48]